MTIITLDFHGYTWEQFLGQIDGERSIILSYRGKLTEEGFVSVQEILHVTYATSLELEKSQLIREMRELLSPTEYLFFSLAKIEKECAAEAIQLIVNAVRPRLNHEKGIIRSDLMLLCKGVCDYLPKQIISNNY